MTKSLIFRICAASFGLLLLPLVALAQDTGVVVKNDTLRSAAFADAKSVGTVKKGQEITILKRSSGWYQVKVGKTEGWLRMLSVRRGQASKSDAAGEVGGVAALATGRAGTGQIVSTTGVRGLSEEDLKGARFDEGQIRKAESYAVSRADAQAFAAKGGLKVVRFDYLPAPQTQSQGAPASKGR